MAELLDRHPEPPIVLLPQGEKGFPRGDALGRSMSAKVSSDRPARSSAITRSVAAASSRCRESTCCSEGRAGGEVHTYRTKFPPVAVGAGMKVLASGHLRLEGEGQRGGVMVDPRVGARRIPPSLTLPHKGGGDDGGKLTVRRSSSRDFVHSVSEGVKGSNRAEDTEIAVHPTPYPSPEGRGPARPGRVRP